MFCSVEVDLSKELQAPTRPILQTQVEAARRGRAIGAEVRFCFAQVSSLNCEPPFVYWDSDKFEFVEFGRL